MKRTIAGFFVVTAWIAMIAVAYATLARAGFVNEVYSRLSPLLMRPDRITYGLIVLALAYITLGALLSLAYPRRLALVCSLVFAGAVALEALQTLTQDRHGTVIDALEKLAGGFAGIALGRLAARVSKRKSVRAEA